MSCWDGCARSCLGAYAHQDVPFEKLVEELQPERATTHSLFFQVLFVLQNAGRESGLSELEVSSLEAETGTSKFDVTLMMSDTGKALRGGFQYNTDPLRPRDHRPHGRALQGAARSGRE